MIQETVEAQRHRGYSVNTYGVGEFKKELRWNEVYYLLAKGL